MESEHYDHIGFYARTLLELDRIDELRFYIPVLEKFLSERANPYISYTLGYILFQLNEGTITQQKAYLNQAMKTAGEDSDLVIKAKMILARLHPTEMESIAEIASIKDKPKDPILGNLLLIWQFHVMQMQGRSRESVKELQSLLNRLPKNEWYSRVSAQENLIRGFLKLKDFDSARSEITQYREQFDRLGSKTAKMHLERLNHTYRNVLSEEKVICHQSRRTTLISHDFHSSRIVNPELQKLIRLLCRKPKVSGAKICRDFNVDREGVKRLGESLKDKLSSISLPSDSLLWDRSQFQVIPKLILS